MEICLGWYNEDKSSENDKKIVYIGITDMYCI